MTARLLKNPSTAGSRIFVGHLQTDDTNKGELEEHFAKYGTVVGSLINRGFGFVQFDNEEAARNAIQKENGAVFKGRRIDVRPVKKETFGPGSGPQGMGGGSMSGNFGMGGGPMGGGPDICGMGMGGGPGMGMGPGMGGPGMGGPGMGGPGMGGPGMGGPGMGGPGMGGPGMGGPGMGGPGMGGPGMGGPGMGGPGMGGPGMGGPGMGLGLGPGPGMGGRPMGGLNPFGNNQFAPQNNAFGGGNQNFDRGNNSNFGGGGPNQMFNSGDNMQGPNSNNRDGGNDSFIDDDIQEIDNDNDSPFGGKDQFNNGNSNRGGNNPFAGNPNRGNDSFGGGGGDGGNGPGNNQNRNNQFSPNNQNRPGQNQNRNQNNQNQGNQSQNANQNTPTGQTNARPRGSRGGRNRNKNRENQAGGKNNFRDRSPINRGGRGSNDDKGGRDWDRQGRDRNFGSFNDGRFDDSKNSSGGPGFGSNTSADGQSAIDKNDCEIIVVNKIVTEYAEMIEMRLKKMGLSVDLLFPNEDVPLSRVLGNIASRGCLYALVVAPVNMEHRSLTLNILHGLPQEHRNMPVDDAITLMNRDFANYKSGGRSVPLNTPFSNERHPDPIQVLVNMLADNHQLTVLQYDRIIKYLEMKREEQIQIELGDAKDISGPNTVGINDPKQAELQSRILNILNSNKPSGNAPVPSPVPAPVSVPPTTWAIAPTSNAASTTSGKATGVSPSPLLNDPTVQKALDSLLQGNLLKNIGEPQSAPTPSPLFAAFPYINRF